MKGKKRVMDKYLAIDLGTKTIGLAHSQGVIATSLGVFRFVENQFNLASDYVIDLVNKDQYTVIVIGYPKNMDNSIGQKAIMVEEFALSLEESFNDSIKIVLFDERLTTRFANQIMIEANLSRKKRKSKKDQLAAQIILEDYLKSISE